MPQTISIRVKPQCALSKTEIAFRQLERAIFLFLDEEDYVSSITLAGASDEILGSLLRLSGKTPALKSFIELCMLVGGYAKEDKSAEKEFAEMANYFRNGLKHYSDGEDIEVSREAAIEILERSISNFIDLTGTHTPSILRFMLR